MSNLETHWPLPASLSKEILLLSFAVAATAVTTPAHAQSNVFDCLMEPARTANLGSPVSGILDSVDVGRGDIVAEGAIIARLRSNVEEASVEIGRTQASDTSRIEAQRVRIELNERRVERATTLLDRQVVSPERFDELQAELALAKSELARETMENRLARLEYEQAKVILGERTIRSPFAGIVSERSLTAGEFVQQDTHIVTLVALDPLNIEVFLPVALYPKITVGMTGTVTPSAPVTGSYEAKVTVVDKVFDAASGSFGVRLSLPNPESRLPGGHRCTVSFPID